MDDFIKCLGIAVAISLGFCVAWFSFVGLCYTGSSLSLVGQYIFCIILTIFAFAMMLISCH